MCPQHPWSRVNEVSLRFTMVYLWVVFTTEKVCICEGWVIGKACVPSIQCCKPKAALKDWGGGWYTILKRKVNDVLSQSLF